MFNNVGGKLKIAAKAICILGIIVSVILSILFFDEGKDVAGLLTLLLGSFGSWVSALLIYGFGEIVDCLKKQGSTDLKENTKSNLFGDLTPLDVPNGGK